MIRRYLGIMVFMMIVVCFQATELKAEFEISEDEFREYFNNDESEYELFKAFIGAEDTMMMFQSRSTLVLERVERLVQFGDGSRYITIMKVNGNIVFCANPYITAGVGLSYDYSSDWNNLSWQTQWRIWMIVRYSYQVEATNNMYVAAQIMIWEAMGYYESPWMDVSNERAVIEYRIANRHRSPSFAGNSYHLDYLESITLLDSNNVLNEMSVSCPKELSCQKKGNELSISLLTERYFGSQNNIRLANGGNTDPSWVGIVYAKAGYQPVLEISNWVEPGFEAALSVYKVAGELLLTKKDEAGVLLPGQRFQLAYDKEFQEIISEYQSDSAGLIKINLPVGTYYLREYAVTNPYELNPVIYTLEIVKNETFEIEIENKFREIELEIAKEDAEEEDKLLNGAVFEVYELESEELLYIVESGKDYFIIDGEVKELDFADNPEFEDSILLTADKYGLFDLSLLPFTEGELYYRLHEEVRTVKKKTATEAEGRLNFKVKWGQKYKVCEIKAPEGYKIADEPCFIVSEEPEAGVYKVSYRLVNHKRRLDLEVVKLDSQHQDRKLDKAVFTARLLDTDEYLGEFVSGALLIKDEADTEYHFWLSETYEEVKTPDYIMTTDTEGKILFYPPQGTYLVQKAGDTDTEEYQVARGKIFLGEFIYGQKVEVCEVSSPPGYHMPVTPCQIVEIKEEYGTDIVSHPFENKRVEIPNMAA